MSECRLSKLADCECPPENCSVAYELLWNLRGMMICQSCREAMPPFTEMIFGVPDVSQGVEGYHRSDEVIQEGEASMEQALFEIFPMATYVRTTEDGHKEYKILCKDLDTTFKEA